MACNFQSASFSVLATVLFPVFCPLLIAFCEPYKYMSTSLVRRVGATQTLNAEEKAYIAARESTVLPGAWAAYLSNVQGYAKASHVSIPPYVTQILKSHNPSHFPRLAVTASGGGYRAAIFSAGVLNALDGRNITSVHAGTGGLLQSASYLSGLSGGAWLVLSLLQANLPMLPQLVLGPGTVNPSSSDFGGWIASIDLLQPSSDPQVLQAFVGLLLQEVAGKAIAGFPITATDIWGRSLVRHFANGTSAANFFNPNMTHGAGITLSGLANLSTFHQHTAPFPLIVADSLSKFQSHAASVLIPGETVPLTNPIYEFSPFEMGSYDPMLSAFTPTRYLGSRNGTCVTNYDQLGWIEGASSNRFNIYNTSAAALAASPIGPIIAAVNATFPHQAVQLAAAAVPNPFLGVAPKTFIDSNQTILALVDGGDNGESTPLQPLILLVKSRGVDVIFVMDAASDTIDNYSNGSSLIASSKRVALYPQSYTFPPIPKRATTFTTEGLSKRPTFFGCNTSPHVPLIVYLANGAAPLGQAPATNTSTGQYAYQSTQMQTMMDQAFDIATQGIPQTVQHGPHPGANSTSQYQKDPEWPVCLACAVVDRSRAKLGILRSGACARCLTRYCWS